MTTKTKVCSYCGDEAKCAGLCNKHYSYVYRWQKEGVARAMRHRDKLIVRQHLLDHVRPANVVPFRPRKRA